MFRSTAIFFIIFAALLIAGMACDQKTDGKTETTEINEPDRTITELDEFVASYKIVNQLIEEGRCKEVSDSVLMLFVFGEALAKAELPKFHIDIAEDFQIAQEKMANALAEFKEARDQYDDVLAKENFDGIRAILISIYNLLSPDIKEFDELHEVVANIWHELLPNEDYDAIRESMGDLMAKTVAVSKAVLPEKFLFLKEPYDKACTGMIASVDDLTTVCEDKESEAMIPEKVEAMHDAYHKIVECLD